MVPLMPISEDSLRSVALDSVAIPFCWISLFPVSWGISPSSPLLLKFPQSPLPRHLFCNSLKCWVLPIPRISLPFFSLHLPTPTALNTTFLQHGTLSQASDTEFHYPWVVLQISKIQNVLGWTPFLHSWLYTSSFSCIQYLKEWNLIHPEIQTRNIRDPVRLFSLPPQSSWFPNCIPNPVYKYLTISSLWFMALTNFFSGRYSHHGCDFEIPVWHHWTCTWEGMCPVSSYELVNTCSTYHCTIAILTSHLLSQPCPGPFWDASLLPFQSLPSKHSSPELSISAPNQEALGVPHYLGESQRWSLLGLDPGGCGHAYSPRPNTGLESLRSWFSWCFAFLFLLCLSSL